jgi:hypothetical protein
MKLSSRGVAQAIKGSKESIRAIADGHSPAIVAANLLVRLLKDSLSLPGKGRVYEYEWRMRRKPIKGLPKPPRPFELKPGRFPAGVSEEWVRPRKAHRASAPGDPPAKDYGVLAASVLPPKVIKHVPNVETVVRVGVYDKKKKVLALEFGSHSGGQRHIAPRPFFRPAIEHARTGMADKMLEQYRKQIRQGKRRRFVRRLFGRGP